MDADTEQEVRRSVKRLARLSWTMPRFLPSNGTCVNCCKKPCDARSCKAEAILRGLRRLDALLGTTCPAHAPKPKEGGEQ